MSLAYCLHAHGQPDVLHRLFRVLHDPKDVFVLHLDRRAPPALHALAADLAATHANVALLPSRPILWGGHALVASQVEAMAVALEHGVPWTHFINLDHRSFPLKTRGEILALLHPYPEANYVQWFDPVHHPRWRNARERLARHYLEWPWLDRLVRLPGLGRRLRRLLGWQRHLPHIPGYRREWPDFFRYYGGANEVVLSRDACRHLAHDPHARRILGWLRHAAHASEIAFPSILLNSPFAATIVNDHLREIDFDLNSSHPRTFTSHDLPRLAASPRLFARPFDDAVDAHVVPRLEEHLQHRLDDISPDVPVRGRHWRPQTL